ncbi:helix-turn-helix transcriptional regulator [Streptomyces sp. SID3343]|uniref:helix-turn-helix domain-containing protein n=1 Tax=Streptomyces sp. SID3343 TaxID=2690260 RepID=UPI0031F9F1D1
MARVFENDEPDTSTGRGLYGSYLRQVRQKAGKTIVQVADDLNMSKTHLSDIERAHRVAPPGFSERADEYFGMGDFFAQHWPAARREMHPQKYRAFMERSAKAKLISEYAGHTVPGLLQTEDYARALIRESKPYAAEAHVEDLVAARMSRQERLAGEDCPRLWAILDEAVMMRPVGGNAVMGDQLAALLPLMDTATTTIQVLPFAHGAHPGLGGSLTLLTLPGKDRFAYLEGSDNGWLIEDLEDVEERQRIYDLLRACALSPKESAVYVERAVVRFGEAAGEGE